MALPPDELRKRIPQWSLESDGQLLQYMVQISKNLEQKCRQTQDNLAGLLLQLDESHIRFANAANGFNGVQQVKFVENRVKDDDESFYSARGGGQEVEEPGERLPHAEVFQMAVEKSIGNMYKCFEKVTVELDSDSDSEDDEEEAAARNTVLRAVQKYPYIRRPLPYIIGSQEWREKWHAGLIDSEEESETETKEQYSDTSSDETDDGMFPSQANSNHTPSESEGSVWGVHADPRRRAPSIDPSMSGDDTMSVHSAASRRLPQHKVPVLPTAVVPSFRPPSLFPEQPPPDDTTSVSSRTKPPNLFEESDEEESTPTHQPVAQPVSSYFRGNQQQQQPRKTVNLFEDEPPEPELTPSTSGGSQQTKKPLNLFIDSDDEGDSFNNNLVAPKVSTPEVKKKLTKLFDEEDDGNDVVNNNSDLFVPVEKSINGLTEGVRRIANLFDDEPPVDDFDEIFKPKATTNKKVIGGKLVLPPVVNKVVVEEKSAVAAAPAKKEVEVTPKKPLNLFDDDDDDDQGDIFKPSVSEVKNPDPVSVAKPKVNLFDDDDSGDEVAPLPTVVPSSKPVNEPNSIRAELLKKKSIFDSDSNDEEEEKEDALFGSKSGQTKEPEPLPRKILEHDLPKEPPILQVSPVKEKPKIPDEPPEDDDTWEQEVPPDDQYPHVANDIDYFLTTNTISSAPEKVVEKVVEEPPKGENLSDPEPTSALNFNSIGLFDDVPPPDDDFDAPTQANNDHGDDFFGSRPASGNTSSSNANRYLFMDDDGPPPDDRDEVDDRKDPAPTKISAIIDEMRHKNEVSQEDAPREKPKINRLSAKVNINVNALLPGARRPAPAVVTVEEPEVPKPAVTEEAVKVQPSEPEVGTGKLTQLNKGRAKIQTKRKPSTRQTRRANYESSLDQNEETRVVVGSEVKPQHVEVTAAHLQINQMLSDELSKKLLEEYKPPEVKQNVVVTTSEPKKPAVIATTPKIQSSSKLFSDDESEDDDLFGKLAKPVLTKPAPTKQIAPPPEVVAPPPTVAKKQSIFDDSDDDDLFSKSKPAASAAAPKLNPIATVASSQPKAATASKIKSIFGSDEDSEGDDIFGSSKKVAPPPKLNAAEKKSVTPFVTAPTQSLFGDDDDEDDLFGAKNKPTSNPVPPSHPTAGVRKPDKPAATAVASTDDPLADLLRS